MTHEKRIEENMKSGELALPPKMLADHGKNFLSEIPSKNVRGMDTSKWLELSPEGDSLYLRAFWPEERIPNLVGMSARDAVHLLESLGVSVKLRGFGRVKRQSLSPGHSVGENTKITLVLG